MKFSPASRARNFLRDVGESLRGASLVSALFGMLLAALLARRIARPISAVSEAAMHVAAGDLSARARLLPGDRETTELARNFNVMAQGLEVLEQERRDTVASIAHELRTPLTVMQARLDAIEDGIYPLDQEQVLQLSAQTQLLTRLVADLRTLSLADAGRLTVQPRQVQTLSMLRAVADDIQAPAPTATSTWRCWARRRPCGPTRTGCGRCSVKSQPRTPSSTRAAACASRCRPRTPAVACVCTWTTTVPAFPRWNANASSRTSCGSKRPARATVEAPVWASRWCAP